MHGGEAILCSDVEVRLALFFIENMRSAVRVHLEDSCKEIGFLGNDVAITPDAGYVAGRLHFLQKMEEFAFPSRREVQRGGETGGIQRALRDLTENRSAEFLGGFAGGFLECAAAF